MCKILGGKGVNKVSYGLRENGVYNRNCYTPSQAPILLNLLEKVRSSRLLSRYVN